MSHCRLSLGAPLSPPIHRPIAHHPISRLNPTSIIQFAPSPLVSSRSPLVHSQPSHTPRHPKTYRRSCSGRPARPPPNPVPTPPCSAAGATLEARGRTRPLGGWRFETTWVRGAAERRDALQHYSCRPSNHEGRASSKPRSHPPVTRARLTTTPLLAVSSPTGIRPDERSRAQLAPPFAAHDSCCRHGAAPITLHGAHAHPPRARTRLYHLGVSDAVAVSPSFQDQTSPPLTCHCRCAAFPPPRLVDSALTAISSDVKSSVRSLQPHTAEEAPHRLKVAH